MELLNSKNYESVSVLLRDFEEPLIMAPDKGAGLMRYLTGDVQTKHVKLTDIYGNEAVVLITDIRLVQPNIKAPDVKEYV